jgi:catechol 2,3-dioxygenase-like lactoylglutathione lyase family enzyme
MISHIHSATVIVSDQDAALDFYVNTLGWEKATDATMGQMRYVTVVPPGATTQIALAHPSWFGDDAPMKFGFTGISLISPDIDATYETLKERGVKFKNPPEAMPWGDKATWFYDPDGNEFFLDGPSN